MRLPFSAIARSAAMRRLDGQVPAQAGVYTSMADFVALEAIARDFSFQPRQPVHSLLSGRYASRVRGRGLAFEELRQYLPGDDIRTMDWRVTARAGKPYVRVYTEEKDRPCLLVVDQRINMFFGSVRAMKSVTAAEVAALCAWRMLGEGNRIGGFVFNDTRIAEVRPHRSRAAALRLADAITTQNGELRADAAQASAPGQLDEVLAAVARHAKRDHLVVVISDFNGHGARTQELLLRLRQANEVLALLVYDPFLLKLPKSGDIVVSDGELQVQIGFAHGAIQRNLASFVDAHAKAILSWQREIGVTVMPISAAEEPAPQLRRLLGQQLAPRARIGS